MSANTNRNINKNINNNTINDKNDNNKSNPTTKSKRNIGRKMLYTNVSTTNSTTANGVLDNDGFWKYWIDKTSDTITVEPIINSCNFVNFIEMLQSETGSQYHDCNSSNNFDNNIDINNNTNTNNNINNNNGDKDKETDQNNQIKEIESSERMSTNEQYNCWQGLIHIIERKYEFFNYHLETVDLSVALEPSHNARSTNNIGRSFVCSSSSGSILSDTSEFFLPGAVSSSAQGSKNDHGNCNEYGSRSNATSETAEAQNAVRQDPFEKNKNIKAEIRNDNHKEVANNNITCESNNVATDKSHLTKNTGNRHKDKMGKNNDHNNNSNDYHSKSQKLNDINKNSKNGSFINHETQKINETQNHDEVRHQTDSKYGNKHALKRGEKTARRNTDIDDETKNENDATRDKEQNVPEKQISNDIDKGVGSAGFQIVVKNTSQHRRGRGPVNCTQCMSCDLSTPLTHGVLGRELYEEIFGENADAQLAPTSQDSLISSSPWTRSFLDAKGRCMFIIVPSRHETRLANLSIVEFNALWSEQARLLKRAGIFGGKGVLRTAINQGNAQNHAHIHIKITMDSEIFSKALNQLPSMPGDKTAKEKALALQTMDYALFLPKAETLLKSAPRDPNIFVDRLCFKTQYHANIVKEALRTSMNKYGKINGINVRNLHKGFAIVHFAKHSEAVNCIVGMYKELNDPTNRFTEKYVNGLVSLGLTKIPRFKWAKDWKGQ
eukprot:Awhi_evm1s433